MLGGDRMNVPFGKSIPQSDSFSSLTAFSWQKVQADSLEDSTAGHVSEREHVLLKGYHSGIFSPYFIQRT